MADPVRNLGTRAGRRGTYDADLERIGGSHLPLLGWYWLSVRPYDPASHRHPCAGTRQPDPPGQEGVRSYAYCGGDPVDCADPGGLAGRPGGEETGGEETADPALRAAWEGLLSREQGG